MRRYLWLRIGIVLVAILGSLTYLYPPPGIREYLYGPGSGLARKGGLLPPTLNLGLDLQGGIHLVLGVDVDKVLESQVERAAADSGDRWRRRGSGSRRLRARAPWRWSSSWRRPSPGMTPSLC